MSWFDKLKSICNIENLSVNLNVNFFSNNTSNKYHIDDEKKILHINRAKLTESEKLEVEDTFREALQENQIFLMEKSEKITEDFIAFEDLTATKDTLNFFSVLLPQKDIEILRAALYIKKKFEERENVVQLKRSIIVYYGNRGKNIANLCSAGYFESYLKPLYNYLKSSEETEEIAKSVFLKTFNIIVEELPYTVFVNREMSKEELEEEIVTKIEKLKKYGNKYINIHGIGQDNISKIREIIYAINDRIPFKKIINERDNIFFARLNLE